MSVQRLAILLHGLDANKGRELLGECPLPSRQPVTVAIAC